MIKYNLTAGLLCCLTLTDIMAQFTPSVSNYFRYGNGERSLGNLTQDFSYFENLTDFRMTLPHSINIGVRLLYDDPPETGPSFQGISRRFIEFSNSGIFLRAGHLNELYGRGLALNLFENRGLAYDTWLDGVKVSYNNSFLKLSVIGGTIDFRDSISFVRMEKYKIRGANIEIEPVNDITIGASFITGNAELPYAAAMKYIKTEIPEVYLNFTSDYFSFFANYAHKWVNVITDKYTSDGSAFYSSFSYTLSGFGITVEYKNYLYDLRDPFEQDDFTRPARMLPFQNPPIVQKEQSYVTLSRAIHEVDFNDETGLQGEIFYSVSQNTLVNIQTGISSRHNSYLYNEQEFLFSEIKRENNFLPSAENEFSPYFEFYTEIEQYFESLSFRIALSRRSKVLYDHFSDGIGSHHIRSTVIPLLVQNTFSNTYSASLQFEYEWYFDNFNAQQENYNNLILSLNNVILSRVNFGFRTEFTTNNFDLSGRKSWILGEAGYRISQNHTVGITVGQERGGQTCSNGICRYVLPFTGIRFSLLSTI